MDYGDGMMSDDDFVVFEEVVGLEVLMLFLE